MKKAKFEGLHSKISSGSALVLKSKAKSAKRKEYKDRYLARYHLDAELSKVLQAKGKQVPRPTPVLVLPST